jgi:pyruvate, orthophosphate dikinase
VTYVYDSDFPHARSFSEIRALLGGKAANLSVMANDLGLPVPPAFTISTEACNAYRADGWPDGLDAEIGDHLATLERRVGRRFGAAADPLLVSVRSGAAVSMPGMMDTILDLGLNDVTTEGLAAASNSAAFAADCRRRFERMFRETVGVDVVPEDPRVQLRAATEAVFGSWESERARTYRRREGISDDLGTAVTVQAMVFGNRGVDSASGVLFTRNPATGEPSLYGDVMFEAQGEDVVAGTHPTATLAALASRLPSVAAELDRYATTLERYHADLCDIEFTIEDGRLWLLQCRIGKRSPQAALRIAVDMAADDDFPLTRRQAVERVAGLLVDPPSTYTGPATGVVPLAVGLPASPGLAAGEIATTSEAAIAAADAGRSVILVRSETSPDDVHGMARASGLLTTHGGLASHAAVVARGWGIPAVVGAADVLVGDPAVAIAGRSIAVGSPITIDGGTGAIFEGVVAGSRAIPPEAETLRGWARELGIEIGAGPPARDPSASASAASVGPAGTSPTSGLPAADRDAVLAALAIKGYATPSGLAEALFATDDHIGWIFDGLVAEGLVEPASGSFRLTAEGRQVASRIFEMDRERSLSDWSAGILDSFHELDHRLKDVVTAWQVRDVDGTQTTNDHGDRDYDDHVMAGLGEVHRDTVGWLEPMAGSVTRFPTYLARLERASRLAAAGDQRYVASPRVDSYHTVWFELHEDLIRLSGRTRAEEVAAGRA